MFDLDTTIVEVKLGRLKGSKGLVRALCNDGTILVDFNFQMDIYAGTWIHHTNLEIAKSD